MHCGVYTVGNYEIDLENVRVHMLQKFELTYGNRRLVSVKK